MYLSMNICGLVTRMKIGDLVRVQTNFPNRKQYGVIIDIIDLGHLIQWINVMYFDGQEEQIHPSRVEVLHEER